MTESTLIMLYALIVGLCVGSFLNVLIYRLPRMMHLQWQQEAAHILETDPEPATTAFNLSIPHSHCPSCEHPIKWWQNIPVISFILLKGKCASCKTAISWRYPLVELTTGLLTLAAASQTSSMTELILTSILIWGLIALMLIDYDTQLLPDSITLPLLWLGLIANSFSLFTDLNSALWGAVIGYLCLWSIYWVFKLLTGKEGMGAGDFKLLACIGAWLGWQTLPSAILLSAGLGSVIGIAMIVFTKRSSQQTIPFGPYLGLAFLVLLFFGDNVAQLMQAIAI